MNPYRFLFVFLLLSSGLHAQYFQLQNSQMPANYTTGATMDVESADLDGDGDLDLILAGEALENYLFFNDGNGKFTIDPDRRLPEKNPADPYPGEDSEDIAVADFDQDNDLDLLFVSEDTPNHELLLNDGSGHFTFSEFSFPSSVANGLAVLDINADNFPDVLIGNKGKNGLFINDGNGGFTDETDLRWPDNTDHTQDLKVLDIDNDGDPDIIEGAEQGGNNVYINNNGIFEEDNSRLPSFSQLMETRKVSIGDLNGDTHPDIYFANVAWTPGISGKDRLLFNDGNGYFTDVTDEKMPPSLGTTLEAAFADYNNDGHTDILTTNFVQPGQTAYAVYLNDGQGNFTSTEGIFPAISYSQGVGLHVADFNADNYPDVYFANYNQTDQLFFFIPPTSTNELSKESLVLYPNPATDVVYIQLPSRGTVEIWDQAGRRIHYTQSDSLLNLNTAGWPSGTYQVQWKSETSSVITTTLIKY
jgi:hypothetical protein